MQAIPDLKKQFELTDDELAKDRIASALIRFGDRDTVWWNYLEAKAQDAITRDAPSPYYVKQIEIDSTLHVHTVGVRSMSVLPLGSYYPFSNAGPVISVDHYLSRGGTERPEQLLYLEDGEKRRNPQGFFWNAVLYQGVFL